jgi:hypothetical protein
MSKQIRGLDGQALPHDVVAVYLQRGGVDATITALEEVQYRLNSAATIFKLIGRLNEDLEVAELCSLCNIAGEWFSHLADTEGEKVSDLGTCLKVARKTADDRGKTDADIK